MRNPSWPLEPSGNLQAQTERHGVELSFPPDQLLGSDETHSPGPLSLVLGWMRTAPRGDAAGPTLGQRGA